MSAASLGPSPCNYNSPGQVVVGGDPSAVAKASDLAKERGGRATPLNVSAAFHTSLMKSAAGKFSRAVQDTPISDPVIPVLGNASGHPPDPRGGGSKVNCDNR